MPRTKTNADEVRAVELGGVRDEAGGRDDAGEARRRRGRAARGRRGRRGAGAQSGGRSLRHGFLDGKGDGDAERVGPVAAARAAFAAPRRSSRLERSSPGMCWEAWSVRTHATIAQRSSGVHLRGVARHLAEAVRHDVEEVAGALGSRRRSTWNEVGRLKPRCTIMPWPWPVRPWHGEQKMSKRSWPRRRSSLVSGTGIRSTNLPSGPWPRVERRVVAEEAARDGALRAAAAPRRRPRRTCSRGTA